MKNSSSFESAQKVIEDYAIEHKMFIPSKLNSVYLGTAEHIIPQIPFSQNNSNAVNYNSNTNRFTYQDQSQINTNNNGYLNRPGTYGTNTQK